MTAATTASPFRLLVTGFGAFPGIAVNSTEAFAPELASHLRVRLPWLHLSLAILPTEWDTAPVVLQHLLQSVQPHVCLHLGVSGAARGLVLESHARNATAERLDARGRLPRRRSLLASAPPVLAPRRSPHHLVKRAQERGLPVSLSLNAGDYLCNAVFFHSLWSARQGRPRSVSFVHLPVRVGDSGRAEDPAHRSEPLDLGTALAGTTEIVSALCEQSC